MEDGSLLTEVSFLIKLLTLAAFFFLTVPSLHENIPDSEDNK